MIGYLDKVRRPLVLVLLKISGYAKTIKSKDWDKDKNNKFMSSETSILTMRSF